jgi:dTDP-4-dehydrorhamnose reductase
VPDAYDLYGRSKLLGEVDYEHSITLRTSIIGRELSTSHGLVEWFLNQKGSVKGYSNAIFSGLPTVELAKIICEYVIPFKELHGLYHVSADPINKHELLTLIAKEFGKEIEIIADESVLIDRSLNSLKFRKKTGYSPPIWSELVKNMREFG